MNFGFDGQYFYLHSAPEGLKIDILKENPWVCIEITQDLKIIPSADVCNTGMKYSSVIVSGRVEFLSGKAERIDALRCIIKHLYKDMTDNGENGIQFNEEHLDGLVIIRVKPEKITGKWSA
jgi:nitroimidazol reductase NimA-like FMN-containing flavoprotein (pyridoxamine 5'-phosphate oxidase superfamily)